MRDRFINIRATAEEINLMRKHRLIPGTVLMGAVLYYVKVAACVQRGNATEEEKAWFAERQTWTRNRGWDKGDSEAPLRAKPKVLPKRNPG